MYRNQCVSQIVLKMCSSDVYFPVISQYTLLHYTAVTCDVACIYKVMDGIHCLPGAVEFSLAVLSFVSGDHACDMPCCSCCKYERYSLDHH